MRPPGPELPILAPPDSKMKRHKIAFVIPPSCFLLRSKQSVRHRERFYLEILHAFERFVFLN
jgi:hypothetical protein